MYGKMQEVFHSEWHVILYVIACISLSYHLLHGFQSAFRTLGLHNKKYVRLVQSIGFGYSILIPLAFAASNALTMLPEFPDVLKPISTSPFTPIPSIILA